VQLPNSPRILSLRLHRNGTHLLANCHDRTVRLLELGEHGLGADNVGLIDMHMNSRRARGFLGPALSED